jgi:hypothetical protein
MRDTLQHMLFPRRKYISKNMLHYLFMQAIPCFHQTNKMIVVDQYMGVVLNVVLAFLLGLYPTCNKKPHFVIRIRLFEMVHILLTSVCEKQQEFLNQHLHIVVLAFMEYIAQVTKAFWCVEFDFFMQENNMELFFEKIPLLCDEFRGMQGVDCSWDEMEVQAHVKIHKCSRARRLNRCDLLDGPKKKEYYDIDQVLDAPVLSCDGAEWEYHLLAHALQIPMQVIVLDWSLFF